MNAPSQEGAVTPGGASRRATGHIGMVHSSSLTPWITQLPGGTFSVLLGPPRAFDEPSRNPDRKIPVDSLEKNGREGFEHTSSVPISVL